MEEPPINATEMRGYPKNIETWLLNWELLFKWKRGSTMVHKYLIFTLQEPNTEVQIYDNTSNTLLGYVSQITIYYQPDQKMFELEMRDKLGRKIHSQKSDEPKTPDNLNQLFSTNKTAPGNKSTEFRLGKILDLLEKIVDKLLKTPETPEKP